MNPPRSACAQHATGEEQRNSSRSNEEGESKQKQCPAVDVSGGESKVRCCKEQYCIGTWNVRSINWGTSGQTGDGNNEHHHFRNQWTKMDQNGRINSNDHYIYQCGQRFLRRNGVALIFNKRVWNAVLGCNLKNDRIISAHFQSKPFNITVIQVYAPTSNAGEAKWFNEDLQDLLELTWKKDVLFITEDWNAKVGNQETPGVKGKFGLGV